MIDKTLIYDQTYIQKVSAGFPTETFLILEPVMLFHQTELLHESLRLRIVTAEVAVDHSLILCATL